MITIYVQKEDRRNKDLQNIEINVYYTVASHDASKKGRQLVVKAIVQKL